MKDGLGDLLPSRAYAKRMLELEGELKRARAFQRRHSKSPETLGRWGLDQPTDPQEGESWFLTYLDMMTLLLVVMIVMFAFSGGLSRYGHPEPSQEATQAAPAGAGGAEGSTVVSGQEAADARSPSPSDASGSAADSSSIESGAAVAANESSTAALEMGSPATLAGQGNGGLLPGGSGLLPGGSGLLPEDHGANSGYADMSGFVHPADAGPLPRDAHMHHAGSQLITGLPAGRRSIDELYPGFTPADLAASFVGPPRPPKWSQEEAPPTAVFSAGQDVAASAPSPAEAVIIVPPVQADDDISEGKAIAAGLALGELGNDVQVVISERSISFRVNSEILFDSSQADLSRSGLAVLRRIVNVLSGTSHEITVEGHTDSVPVRRNVRYPSNWELSSARAGSVVRYLQANGIARQRLKAVGYADTRPIGDNHTPEGRAANRRVELVIEKRG